MPNRHTDNRPGRRESTLAAVALIRGREDPWRTPLWDQVADLKNWNGERGAVPIVTTYTPTISASTTATNLSSLEVLPLIPFRSNRKMNTLKENLKSAQPEIEPLQSKAEKDVISDIGSINRSQQHEGDVYRATTVQKPVLHNQVITALSVSLVSFVIGFVSGYTSPVEQNIKKDLQLDDDEFSWVGGLMPLGALVGGLIGGQSIEFIGRKYTIVLTDILFIVSWIFIALANNIWLLYVGRIIVGVAVGLGSLALPVFLGETVQPEIRGTLGLLPTAFGNLGILAVYIAGAYLSWYELAYVGVAIPLPFILLSFFIPESPRWYVTKKRPESARHALQWLRGKNVDISEEFENLSKSQKESDESTVSVLELFRNNNLKPLLISLGLMFFQQLSGINAVIFYTTHIFNMAHSNIGNYATIIVGVVNFLSTFIATVLIDRLGRKILLYVSSAAMTLTLAALGTYFYLIYLDVPLDGYGAIPLVSFVIYVIGFSLGFGAIPWLMMGELFSAKIRGPAASVATAFNWTCTFIVTKTYLHLINEMGAYGVFWMYSIICALSLVFVIIWVPETQGQSLLDIEKKLAGLKVRRMSSVANLKPLPSTF